MVFVLLNLDYDEYDIKADSKIIRLWDKLES